ncbi:MAG: PHP domain-containing protein [Clostridiales bacterium]|nr:PHP domain-containing protein [Clostridiales bacterium]HBM81362.1 PHP domain-containing protein [Clostridiaceae bacterium]
MLTRGDLHIHSTASDGDFSPWEIVKSAKEHGVDTIAITDHNSTDGINEAASAGRQYGVAVIPAVELSTKYGGERVHILGYFKNNRFNDSILKDILTLVKEHDIKTVRNILKDFVYIKGYEDHLSVPEGIALLKTFGAAAVLAHPVRIRVRNLPAVLSFPFDGIEAKYCNNSRYDTLYFINIALSRFSFYTGGSDFHTNRGSYHTHCSIGNPSLNQMEIQIFLRNSGAIVLN